MGKKMIAIAAIMLGLAFSSFAQVKMESKSITFYKYDASQKKYVKSITKTQVTELAVSDGKFSVYCATCTPKTTTLYFVGDLEHGENSLTRAVVDEEDSEAVVVVRFDDKDTEKILYVALIDETAMIVFGDITIVNEEEDY